MPGGLQSFYSEMVYLYDFKVFYFILFYFNRVRLLFVWCILMQLGKDYILREYTSRESQVSELDVSDLMFPVRTAVDGNNTHTSLSVILLLWSFSSNL